MTETIPTRDSIPTTDTARLLSRTAELATDYLTSLAERPVSRPVDLAALRSAMGGPLPDGPTDPLEVVEALSTAADPGIVATAGPRFENSATRFPSDP